VPGGILKGRGGLRNSEPLPLSPSACLAGRQGANRAGGEITTTPAPPPLQGGELLRWKVGADLKLDCHARLEGLARR